MNLVEVEVLQGEVVALQQARDGVGRCHEQAVRAVDEVDSGGLGVYEECTRLEVVLGGPLLGAEEGDRGAVGQWRGIARRHGGLGAVLLRVALAEDRLELGQGLQGGVRAQVGIAVDAEEAGGQVGEEALLPGLVEVLVGGQGELVLGLARHAHLARGDRGVLTHGQAGARLAVLRLLRGQLGGTDGADELCALCSGLRAGQAQQGAAQGVVDGQRSIGRGVRAAGDTSGDAALCNGIAHVDGGGQ